MKVFTIENELLKAVFLDYGATLHQLWVKDKKGVPTNVIMGLETPKEYLDALPISIEHSDGVLLHSGSSGWNTKTWNLKEEKKDMISFSHFCPEGASGFPGYVEAEIMYHLKENSRKSRFDQSTLNRHHEQKTTVKTTVTHGHPAVNTRRDSTPKRALAGRVKLLAGRVKLHLKLSPKS